MRNHSVRKAIMVTAFAAVIGTAMMAPAVAYEAPGNDGWKSQACDVDARLLHSDPHMCSRPVFSDANDRADEPVTSHPSPTSSIPQWTVYSLVAILVLAAATTSAIRRGPRPLA